MFIHLQPEESEIPLSCVHPFFGGFGRIAAGFSKLPSPDAPGEAPRSCPFGVPPRPARPAAKQAGPAGPRQQGQPATAAAGLLPEALEPGPSIVKGNFQRDGKVQPVTKIKVLSITYLSWHFLHGTGMLQKGTQEFGQLISKTMLATNSETFSGEESTAQDWIQVHDQERPACGL